MQIIFALCAVWIFLHCSQQADASTGCPGNGPTNSHLVVEYIFHEGAGSTAFNTGTGGDAGNATLTNGVVFSTDVPPANTNCSWSASLPATGSGATTPALGTGPGYDPLAGAAQFVNMAWLKRESLCVSNNTAAPILSDIDSPGTTANGFEFRFSGQSGLLTFTINGKDRQRSAGGIAPNSNASHHGAMVYDRPRPATNALTRHADLDQGPGGRTHAPGPRPHSHRQLRQCRARAAIGHRTGRWQAGWCSSNSNPTSLKHGRCGSAPGVWSSDAVATLRPGRTAIRAATTVRRG